jgi:hypothetical protein
VTNDRDAKFQEVLETLRRYLISCGPDQNENDRAFVIVGHCIVAELNTKLRICQMTKALGRSTPHVAAFLDSRTGPNPRLHDWYVDADGRYWLHDS